VSEAVVGRPDTEWVSAGAWVGEVDAVLNRAQQLFGDPADTGAVRLQQVPATLRAAADRLGTDASEIACGAGAFVDRYHRVRRSAGAALGAAGRTDTAVAAGVTDALSANRAGGSETAAVRAGTAADTATLAPYTGLPAWERLLLARLRQRVLQQREVIAAYRERDARLAARLRAARYPGAPPAPAGAGGGFPPPGGGGGALSPAARVGHRAPAGSAGPRTELAARHEPAGRGRLAVAAAMSRLGAPYVWGAKGPNVFDCSGLTQWAWGQAGVQLGADTYTQIAQGAPVAPGDVQPGDLIFPSAEFDHRGPGHVQLAISATQVIQAPQSGDVVKVSPMPHGFVARRPV
jgi:cell wall-associated NlpC family hydrolase